VLAPQTTITVTAVNDAGATIAGDAISAVVLYGDLAGPMSRFSTWPMACRAG
jgi:sugar/nucleoside kinase (ribokinase family)